MTFRENIATPLVQTLHTHGERKAFCIDGIYYTYRELADATAKIRQAVRRLPQNIVALEAHDDLYTYASILALWLEGKCYVPLHPHQPLERCLDILSQLGTDVVLDSGTATRYTRQQVVMTTALPAAEQVDDTPVAADDADYAYILFTSGSTGRPKGVPVMRGNVAAFVDAFRAMGCRLNADDRCLQMFDLTFDLSVQSFLLPLLHGCCIYTIGHDRIKYQAAFDLLDAHAITFALLVPSVIHYLRPYMEEIELPELRYSLFCGEALSADDTEQWSRSVPNARIINVYGPTENTIYCTAYDFRRDGKNKEKNGILCIGRDMKGTKSIVVDEQEHVVCAGEKGELCLSGRQLFPGYWHDEAKNSEAFFTVDGTRYYRTGDICSKDADGDLLYYGRKDSQIKIGGYRIELSEIECVARKFYQETRAVVALPLPDESGEPRIHLVVEGEAAVQSDELQAFMRRFLPVYMLPAEIHRLDTFPQNMNNKTDRRRIAELIGG